MEHQYTRLVGDTAKFPYLVGISTPRSLGSGILLNSRLVLTCNHTRDNEDFLKQYVQVTVITASGPVNAEVECLDEQSDLALVRLDREFHASAPGFADRLFRPGERLIAVGVQPVPGSPDSLTLAEIDLAYRNRNEAADGVVLDIQLDGGARPGYSGGPVVLQVKGRPVCIGMTRWGGTFWPSSNAIGMAHLRAFVEKYLPGSGLLGPAEDSQAEAVQRFSFYSDKAREGLEPRILSRIRRAVVHEKYLPAIRRGVEGEKKRIVPIIAPAGYGKSTLLGEIYDELIKDGRWGLLLRCSDLTISADLADQLSARMGQAVSEDAQPILSVVQRLTSIQGSGVMLIDTLDLILNGPLVPAFRRLLLDLTELGTTVVFTCRDYEYDEFIEPVSEKLAGLSGIVDRYKVPLFSNEEVVKAAQKFIENRLGQSFSDRAASFGKAILDLSADNRPLRELARNPLLLALICGLFGETGEVPQDLTVSRLYTTYWERKISRSRSEKFPPYSAVALRKEEISLQLAETLASRSRLFLVDSLFPAELRLPADKITDAARSDLMSEDVVQFSPSGRISFFHQTFLEYAIARWLALEVGRSLRNQIVAELSQVSPSTPLYWWPVIRQLLVMVSNEEFKEYSALLNLNHLGAFRAAAFAAASRDNVAALSYLRSMAPGLPTGHQQTLLHAIDGVHASFLDEAFHIATMLLRHGDARVATNAARVAGTLFTRYQAEESPRLLEALSAIQERPPDSGHEQDSAPALMGAFFRSQRARKEWAPSPDVLKALRQQYLSLSDTHRSYVVDLHLDRAVPLEAQGDLVRRASTRPLSNTGYPEDLRPRMVCLCEKAMLALLPTDHTGLGDPILHALHAHLPEGWEPVQALSVGAILSRSPEEVGAVVEDLITAEGKERVSRNLRALKHAARLGGSDAIFMKLASLRSDMPAAIFNRLRDLSRDVARHLKEQKRKSLLLWADTMLGQGSHRGAVPADVSFQAGHGPAIDQLATIRQQTALRAEIELAPPEMVDGLIAETQSRLQSQPDDRQLHRILSEFYLKLAVSSSKGVLGLVELSLSRFESQATKASLMLAALAQANSRVSAADLRPFAESRFPGVRRNRIEGLIQILNRDNSVPESDFENVCDSLLTEENPVVVNRSYEFVMRWVRTNRRITDIAAESLATSMRHLLKTARMNDGIIRSIIIAFKVLAQTEEQRLIPGLRSWVEELITSVNISKPDDGEPETADLLSAMERISPGFLTALVGKCPTIPAKNIRAIVCAIKNVDGPQSPLLKEIRHAEWCPADALALILLIQGL